MTLFSKINGLHTGNLCAVRFVCFEKLMSKMCRHIFHNMIQLIYYIRGGCFLMMINYSNREETDKNLFT